MMNYRNQSISHWDAGDTQPGTAWDGEDLTIHRGFVGEEEELQRRIASGEPEFQMTVPVPNLYDLLDTYAAGVQLFLEANDRSLVRNYRSLYLSGKLPAGNGNSWSSLITYL